MEAYGKECCRTMMGAKVSVREGKVSMYRKYAALRNASAMSERRLAKGWATGGCHVVPSFPNHIQCHNT